MLRTSVGFLCLAELPCYFYCFQNGCSLEIPIFLFLFFIHTKKNYAFFLTKQRYPIQIQKDLTTGEGYGYIFF